jgi:hypothetical protein
MSSAEVDQPMTEIIMNIETVWTPSIEFRDCKMADSDLAAISSTVNAIAFVGWRSKEWAEIVRRLITLPQLEVLST